MVWTITPQQKVNWTPSLITTALWLDAADASTVFSDAGTTQAVAGSSTVQQWNDKSGNNRNFTQGNSSLRPAYLSNGLNSLPGIVFDGIDDRLASTENLSSAFSVAASLFLVYQVNNNDQIYSVYYSGVNGNTEYWRYNGDGNAYLSSFRTARVNNSLNSQMPQTGAHLISILSGSSAWQAYLNGTAGPAQVGSFSSGGVHEMGYGPLGGPLNGSIAEVVLTNTFASAYDRQRIEGYLAHKWGLTANLPSNHPFKVNPPAP